MVSYSIIIPVFNAEKDIESCLKSIFFQTEGNYEYEILITDDSSTDSTQSILNTIQQNFPNIRLFQTHQNSGPGIARNIGLSNAKNDWILFLDSDDKLSSNALSILTNYIENASSGKEIDIIGFNWLYDNSSDVSPCRAGGRTDALSLQKTKDSLLKDFVSLWMDGSVIYTLVRRQLITQNNLRFFHGIHEDVDFIFKVYFCANNINYIDEPLYFKKNRSTSIVNTISISHINGYFRAFSEILHFIKQHADTPNKFTISFLTGLIGIVATKVRDIYLSTLSNNEKYALYHTLHDAYLEFYKQLNNPKIINLQTKYGIIFNFFLEVMQCKNNSEDVTKAMSEFMQDIHKKSWSCYDLHHSVFLRPNEIAACCKRFFVGSEMKGEVTLVHSGESDLSKITPELILKSKQNLYYRINKGLSSECSGCPFLEFKDWGYINELKIEHISLEYHSLCNMKCIYCSEKYYDGSKPDYDVEKLIKDLFSQNSLDHCKSIVWGGGEPTVDKSFEPLIKLIADKLPHITQRVITNSVKFSNVILDLLAQNKATVVTSVDAGTQSTFKKVRVNSSFDKVFENLRRYYQANSKNITIKYIINQNNNDPEEILNFVKLIETYRLIQCNFQISYDFTEESTDFNSIIAAIMLYGGLNDLGCYLIIFDDLLRQRLNNLSESTYNAVKNRVSELGLSSYLANSDDYKEVAIWGAGIQTKMLIENTFFFKQVKVRYIVDLNVSYDNMQPKKLLGIEVLSPSVLLDTNIPVLISAVQRSPIIYKNYLQLGLEKSRLIKGLII